MNALFKYLWIFTLTLISCNSPKQPANEFEKLLCKKWKVVAYEEGGKRFDTPEIFQNNRMKFSLNHTVESSGDGNISIGDWRYDDSLKTITIVDKVTNENVIIGVKNISENEFVVQIGNANERMLTLFMKPDSE